MFHVHADPRSGWSALAVAGLIAGVTALPPAPSDPAPTPRATPTPTMPVPSGSTAMPTGPPIPSTSRTLSMAPTAPRTHQVTPRSGHSHTPAPAGQGPRTEDAAPVRATWTLHLPTPETGRKIFAAGLVGLAVAIGGLAILAIRRREL